MNNSRISKVEIIEKLNRVTDKLLKLERPENEAELQNLGRMRDDGGILPVILAWRNGIGRREWGFTDFKSSSSISRMSVIKNMPSFG